MCPTRGDGAVKNGAAVIRADHRHSAVRAGLAAGAVAVDTAAQGLAYGAGSSESWRARSRTQCLPTIYRPLKLCACPERGMGVERVVRMALVMLRAPRPVLQVSRVWRVVLDEYDGNEVRGLSGEAARCVGRSPFCGTTIGNGVLIQPHALIGRVLIRPSGSAPNRAGRRRYRFPADPRAGRERRDRGSCGRRVPQRRG